MIYDGDFKVLKNNYNDLNITLNIMEDEDRELDACTYKFILGIIIKGLEMYSGRLLATPVITLIEHSIASKISNLIDDGLLSRDSHGWLTFTEKARTMANIKEIVS